MNFIQNKYVIWYYSIIKNAQARTLNSTVYSENHHIIPRSIGGSNSKNNIVKLYAREHFICHLLLPKFTTGNAKKKMERAALMLTVVSGNQQRYKITNRVYEMIKKNFSLSIKGIIKGPHSESHKENISKAKKGKPLTAEHKKALTGIKKGRPWSQKRISAGRKVMTPHGIFNSMSEAERELKLGANCIAYRIKTQPDKYYKI
jgi:ribosomal protein L34E